jgi:hypothetical protein
MEPSVGIEPTHRRYKLRKLPLHHDGIKMVAPVGDDPTSAA